MSSQLTVYSPGLTEPKAPRDKEEDSRLSTLLHYERFAGVRDVPRGEEPRQAVPGTVVFAGYQFIFSLCRHDLVSSMG